MNAKFTLALVALVSVGVFALPSTVALFAGQHTFVNIDATGNQIECVKCHGDIQAEIDTNGDSSTVTGTHSPHANFKCEYCHRIEQGSASGDNAYATIPYSGIYWNGTANVTISRTLAVSVMDMEAGNYPAVFNNSIVNATGLKNLPTVGVNGNPGIPFGTGKGTANLQPASDTTPIDLTVGALNGVKLVATYDPATGKPLDKNDATKNLGLDLSKATGWVAVSRGYALNLTGAGSRTVNPGSAYHAASLVSCMECHGGDEPIGHYSRVADGTDLTNSSAVPCSNCHYSDASHTNQIYTLWAGGFGLTSDKNDNGSIEAHTKFQTTSDNMSRQMLLNGKNVNNGACVACHTHVAVDISYNRPTVYSFTATKSTDGSSTIDGFSAKGNTQTSSTGS